MGLRRLWPLAIVALFAMLRVARADGVCVAIDTTRDTLGEQERAAVTIAIATALEAEGVVTDRATGRCTATVTAYNIRLDRAVTTTIAAGGRNVTGQASSIDELDLLVRQLVRSLVTGRAFATGTGVQDRENVLRDQTAPRRADPASREWVPTIGVGGGMLQLPAIEDRAMQRQYNIVVLDGREWLFSGNGRTAMELRARLVFHDYAVFGAAKESFEDNTNGDDKTDLNEFGHGSLLLLTPFAVANIEPGIGFVAHLGDHTPRPFGRAGVTLPLLFRFSDPDHRFDIGYGAYFGLGFQLTKHASMSVEANVSRPLVHDFIDSGYAYFLTTTAMLEYRGSSRRPQRPILFPSEPVPTVRRINE